MLEILYYQKKRKTLLIKVCAPPIPLDNTYFIKKLSPFCKDYGINHKAGGTNAFELYGLPSHI